MNLSSASVDAELRLKILILVMPLTKLKLSIVYQICTCHYNNNNKKSYTGPHRKYEGRRWIGPLTCDENEIKLVMTGPSKMKGCKYTNLHANTAGHSFFFLSE